MTEPDPTQRFSDRADNYARYRPGYPPAVLDCLRDEFDLTLDTVVADVGSGTGILTELFLKRGYTVYAVEPNEAMRTAAERALARYPRFISVAGRAEATGLPDGGVGLVAAGQAFHWFDAPAARQEFSRILTSGGRVALVWNARLYTGDPFMAAYEGALGSFGLGYHAVTHRSHRGEMDALFTAGYEARVFQHSRPLDWDALWGGFLSASYAPLPGDPRYEPLRRALRDAFDAHQRDGRVTFYYDTNLYVGSLA
jgi:SAM-dependent methyltransferase